MNNHEIDELLKEKNKDILDAHKEIIELQKGEKDLLLTGIDHLDYFLIGGLSNNMVFVGARPSQGKTFMCDETITNLLDEKINKSKLSILRLNLEMTTKNLLLRDLKRNLNKKMRDIVSTPYTLDEQEVVKKVVAKHRDKRVTNWTQLLTADNFEYLLKKFIENSNEEFGPECEKIILIDHIHIYADKKTIDEILGICNKIKLKDTKVSFIIFFQLNRILENLWRGDKDSKANPRNFRPNSSHIYNTDSLMQYADVITTLVIPQTVNLDEYAVVSREYYSHLEEHFVDADSIDNKTARLKGRNRIYYDYIKTRMSDDFEDPKLYCRVLNPEIEETVAKKYDNKPTFKTPIFDAPKPEGQKPLDVKFNTSTKDAFGEPEGEDVDNPF
jgi:hypothetical protein